MKTNILILTIIKTFFILLIISSLFTCSSHFNEYTIVESVSKNNIGKEKYKVELRFFGANQYLYTDSVFAVGDTLRFHK